MNKRTFSNAFVAVAIIFFLSCNKSLQPDAASTPRAKNIILLIGDGMGLAQLSTAYYFGQGTPNFSRFKYIGLHQNTPVGEIITDSASGATAFSIGLKTYNAAIGVDKDSIAHETILEWASKNGKSTGVIATSTITHATPASFYAHVGHREMHEEIALDLVNSTVDVAIGAGHAYFNQRKDGRNLLNELEAKGVHIDTTALPGKLSFGQRYAFLLAANDMPRMTQGRGDFLTKATNLSLDFLSEDKQGFFLMVEGSQIDWGGHSNEGDYIVQEVLDFNQAVGAALDFAERDGNTLVIVTADHETGGLALSGTMVFGRADYNNISLTFSTGGHTASLIPVLAFGPGSEKFTGFYQNNDIYTKMMSLFAR